MSVEGQSLQSCANARCEEVWQPPTSTDAGVSTAILVFTKGGLTDDVFFYKVEHDGFTPDDKREPRPDKNELPSCLEAWRKRNPERDIDRTKNGFFISAEQIRQANYELSLKKYQDPVYEVPESDPPAEILARIKKLNAEISSDLTMLGDMLG